MLVAASLAMGQAITVAADAPAGDPRGLEVFTTHLRPLLAHRCGGCHGAGSVESGFDISTREKLLAGGESGAAVVPGSAVTSRMYRLAARLEEPHMPEEGDALTEEELGWLAEWINRGAPYDRPLIDDADRGPWTGRQIAPEAREFWAFRPLGEIEPPRPADPHGWCRNPIDRFILAALERVALTPSPEAPPHTLRRRLAFDLTGLPATAAEIAAFTSDPSVSAYERAVDDLLGRPAFGERWAQHWLDVARFAESFGYEQDYDRPHAFHYRDFVIKAFNDDLPYDMFVRWQIAGDELAPDTVEAWKATGFLAAGAFPTQLTEKEFESARYGELDDMIGTLGTAMLGMTIGCARCHDHKFDPIPQADYYRLAATLTTTIRANVDVHVDPGRHRADLTAWQARLDAAIAARDAYERDELPGKRAAWAAAWVPPPPPTGPSWQLGTLVKATSQSGGSFVPLADGSVLAGGDPRDRDVYTFEIDSPLETVAALRLDAFADPSLPRGGPGRSGHGNFALSNLTVAWTPIPAPGTAAAKPTPIRLTAARADFSQTQPDLAVAYAIDGDAGSSWAIDPKVGVSHAATFDFAEPVRHAGGMRLTVKLEFMNNSRHAIGRPRLSFSEEPAGSVDAVTPERDPVDALASDKARVTRLLALPESQRTPETEQDLLRLHRRFDPGWQALDATVSRVESERPTPDLVKVLVASENVPHIPHHADGRGYPHFYKETYFLRRGDPAAKEGVATPALLQAVTRHPAGLDHWAEPVPADAKTSHRRAVLARWITDIDAGAGPLAARVIVNRLWQHHFGEGLVTTPSDFGRQGEPPSHPELLEWLAGELVRGGWRLKPIHRLMVTSAAYRQSSAVDSARSAIDPHNRLVWRFNRRRLEGEAIRDTLLSLSGALDPTLYGRAGRDETTPRRSLYLEMKRSRLPTFLRTFDSPDYVSGLAKRPVTTTAPQALVMMNSPAVREWAKRFAARLSAHEPLLPPAPGEHPTALAASTTADSADVAGMIAAAYSVAVGRGPSAVELQDARSFIDSQTAAHAAAGRQDAATAARIDFCQVLLGLNETLHIE
ncbi:MAG: PSD1 and planctomycete cytochrome C domain-containing protein [Planctomycetaceae bacterium]